MKKVNLLILFYLLSLGIVCAQQIDYLGGVKKTPNNNFPVSNTTNQSYSQSIYLSSELTNISTIYGIEYSVNSGALSGGNNWDIYLGQTNKTTFLQTTGHFERNGLIKVYEGNVSVASGKITIFFDTPFTYSNTNNLVIAIHKKNAGNGTIIYDQVTNGAVRSLLFQANTIDATNLPSNSSAILNANPSNQFPRNYWRPYMGFITTPKCLPSSNFTFTNTNSSGTRIDFDGKNGQTWDLSVGGQTKTLTDTFDFITGLSNNQIHTVNVTSDCGTGGISSSTTTNFRTTICDNGPVTRLTEDFSSPNIFSSSCWSRIGRPNPNASTFSTNQSGSEIRFGNTGTGILVLPELKDISSGKLTFTYSGIIQLLQIGTVNIPYESSNTVYTNFETIINHPGNFNTRVNTPITTTIDLSSYSGTDKFLVIRAKAPNLVQATVTVDDVIFNGPDTIINKNICSGDTYTFKGLSLNTSGEYYDTIQVNLVDSIVKLNLNVIQNFINTVDINSCQPYTTPSGILRNTSGTYNDTLPNQYGCDSIIITNLTISNMDLSNIDVSPKEVCNDTDLFIPLPDAQLNETYTLIDIATGDTIDGPKKKSGESPNALGFGLNTGLLLQDVTLGIQVKSKTGNDHNGAISFAGIDNYVDLPVPTNFDYNNQFTFEGWIKSPLPNNTKQNALFYIGNTAVSDIEVYIQQGTNNLTIVYNRSTNGSASGVFKYDNVPDNIWYHLAITHNGIHTKVYFNGIEQTPISQTLSSPNTSLASSINLGRINSTAFKPSWGNELFIGEMDEVRFWNTVRSTSQINANKKNCLNGNETGLVYYLPFEKGTGNTVTDHVSNNDFTLSNFDVNLAWVNGSTINCGSTCIASHTPQKPITVITLDNGINQDGNDLKVTVGADSYKWFYCDGQNAQIPNINTSIYSSPLSGNYKAEITKGSCVKETNCYAFWLNSLNTLSDDVINIAPNPAQNIITIESPYKILKSEIYNTSGILIQEFQDGNKLDISSLKQGVYNFKIYTPFGVSYKKIIKE